MPTDNLVRSNNFGLLELDANIVMMISLLDREYLDRLPTARYANEYK
jgi:hypothetical protein